MGDTTLWVIGFFFLVGYLLLSKIGKKLHHMHDENSLSVIRIHSFTSGILLAALVLRFFSEVYHSESMMALCIMVVSFTLFFGLNRYIQHCNKKKEVRAFKQEISILRFVFLVLHHLLIGLLFAELAEVGVLELVSFGIAILFTRTILSFEFAHQKAGDEPVWKEIFIDGVTFIGFFAPLFVVISELFVMFALAFVAGVIFYLIIDQVLAKTRVSILFMILGELLYGLLLAGIVML